MSDDIDLTEILEIDRDVALELAETSSAIALARAGDDFERLNRRWEREAISTGQVAGRVNLASISRAEVGVLQTATLATQAAVNLLVVDQPQRARDHFRLASALVAPYSSNDAAVLGTCADPITVATGELPVADVTLSRWVIETLALLQLASGSSPSFDVYDPDDRVGAGASSEPPPGVSLAGIGQSRIALSGAVPGDGPMVWSGLLAGLEALVVDATSPLEGVIGATGWANQTGSLFPLEPEILMLGLIGAIWRQRGPEFGLGDDQEVTFTEPARRPRLAVAVGLAADRLLETRPSG